MRLPHNVILDAFYRVIKENPGITAMPGIIGQKAGLDCKITKGQRIATIRSLKRKKLIFENKGKTILMRRFNLPDKCVMCGRRLTNPISVSRGIGPVCGGRGYYDRAVFGLKISHVSPSKHQQQRYSGSYGALP